MTRIVTCLWYDDNAEEAANFYAATFRRASVGKITKGPAGGEPHVAEGKVLTVEFEIEGQAFVGLNGGKADYAFNEAISFQVPCADQAEIDEYWEKLSVGGRPVACGWIQDKYGLFWQIFPETLPRLLADHDRAKAARAMAAMMKMVKIDVAAIEAAALG